MRLQEILRDAEPAVASGNRVEPEPRPTKWSERLNHSVSNRSLESRATTAVGWNLAGSAVRSGAAFGINILLARVLGPEPYGLIAVAMLIISLANLIVDSGLAVQLIQKPDITESDVRSTFTLQVILGTVLSLGLVAGAPLFAVAVKQPSVESVLRVLAIVLLLGSLAQTSSALLRRQLNYKGLQQVQISSYIVGYGVIGIPLALLGAGVWALVSAQLFQALLYAGGTWMLTRHSLLFRFGPETAAFLNFGSRVVATNVVSWGIGSLPTFFVGFRFGVSQLGIYSRAFMITGVPLTIVASSLQTVSLPLYSRLNNEESAVVRTYLALIALISLISFPAFLLLGAAASPVIHLLLGSRWYATANLILPLAAAMPFDAVAALSSALLIGRGRPDLDLKMQIVTLSAGAVAVSSALWLGSLAAVAWGVCLGIYVVRAVAACVMVRKVVVIAWADLMGALRGGVGAGISIWIVATLVDRRLADSTFPAAARLAMACACAGAILVTAFMAWPKFLLHRDIVALVANGRLPLHASLQNRLSRHLGIRERTK